MFSLSQIELSQSALENNLKFLKNEFGDSVKFSSVVKGNAYGHGITEFVTMAKSLGQKHFSVFSVQEARKVKLCGSELGVMIMGYIDEENMGWAILEDVSFFVFDIHRLKMAVQLAKVVKKPARIHLELETGMNRTGLNGKELTAAMKILEKEKDWLYLEGVCTHYAGAESVANFYRIQKQISRYHRMYKRIEEKGFKPEFKHTACSAAAFGFPKTRMDMVRIGIMQYGFWPSYETLTNYFVKRGLRENPLKRVISWKTRVMAVENVDEGNFIGYGTTYMARSKMKVAVIPVGYSNGFARDLSNQGRMLINGARVGVVGIVNMNMIMVDISDIPETKVGDEVVLIGEQDGKEISVASFGELSNQLNYELLTRLPHDIPRKIVD